MGPVTERTTLHLLLCADRDAVLACQRMVNAGDTVFLLADGVMVLAEESLPDFGNDVEIFYARADLDARGLSALAARTGVVTATDHDVARLLRVHHHCVSWK